jgi:hypothetical protein
VAQRGRPVGWAASRSLRQIVEIDLLADPGRLRELDLTVLED